MFRERGEGNLRIRKDRKIEWREKGGGEECKRAGTREAELVKGREERWKKMRKKKKEKIGLRDGNRKHREQSMRYKTDLVYSL